MKKYPVWAHLAAVAAMLCLLVVMLLTAFSCTVFDRGFIDREMKKFQVADRIGMNQESLMELYDEVLKYLEDERDDLDITVTRDGTEMKAFNEKEILHMVDVEALFRGGFWLRYICAVLGLALILLCVFTKQGGALFRGFCIASGVFVALVAGVGLAVLIDFDTTFTLFHRLFFNNDLWILDYRTDLLMNIVPESFSYDVALRTILYFGGAWALLLLSGILTRRFLKKRGEGDIR